MNIHQLKEDSPEYCRAQIKNFLHYNEDGALIKMVFQLQHIKPSIYNRYISILQHEYPNIYKQIKKIELLK